MNRRELMALVGVAITVWPLAARTQQPKILTIGVLSPFSRTGGPSAFDAFGQTLRNLGWTEGKNLAFEYRWADGKADRLPDLAADLVRLNVDLIFDIWGTPAALAAKRATATTPIVFAVVGDAVGVGLVDSLSRPGGNVTGLTYLAEETIAKQLEFLKEIFPPLSRVAVLVNPTNPVYGPVLKASEAPARTLHLQLQTMGVRDASEFDSAFEAAVKEGAEGIVGLRDPVIMGNRSRLLALVAKYRLLAVWGLSEFAEEGGLMSHGPDLTDMYRRCAHMVDKLLKGAKPRDVPVEQAARFRLVINLKTAKALGLIVPQTLLARADEVIE
jgi:putative tryptophan/tyrosine transport system substrate-binding protein